MNVEKRLLRAWLVPLAAIAVWGRASAEPSMQRLRACMSESSDAVRLACYDREMGRTPAGQPADFGLTPELMRKKQAQENSGVAPPTPQQESMSATVTHIATRSTGRLVITLDNGQVWEQQEDADLRVSVGDVVTVKSGVLGALYMRVPHHARESRVKRIK